MKSSPPDDQALEDAIRLVRHQLQQLDPLQPDATIIGVAGTLTTLAALDLRIPGFDRDLVHRHILSTRTIERLFQELRPLTLEQLRSYPQIHPSRADILLAGIIILKEFLGKVLAPAITVSDRGLRYGMAINTAQTFFKNNR